ncbi:MAG: GH32 C-terminal domain-containing protein [Candidatus Nealsonbacteria bacterium]|nr:GH32 C-terminal domain-containing protein [Candidatus Nealsonbacteria bacterium]
MRQSKLWKTILAVLAVTVASPAAIGSEKTLIADKTLVAWVAPANLTQRGGSVLTIERAGDAFDAIVLGELAAGKWMAGSNGLARTEKQQQDWPAETADADTLVQIAVVYKGKQVTIYRNGNKYADYTAKGSERFGSDSFALLGLRHVAAMPEGRFFTGSIDDARIYNAALDAKQIAALKPNEPSKEKPFAWWDFEQGRTADRMNALPVSTLQGDARIVDGRLQLVGNGAYMTASRTAPKTGLAGVDLGDVNSSARALREHLLEDPYRPGYHFAVPEGRCMPFDPNGAVFWKGRYHLFYIFQDKRGHNWGHVSSTDLFHWRHHPTGLTAGMFSGNCFINKDGRPTMCYHQVGQGNAMAVAVDDQLNEWEKLESNPITPETTEGDPHHGKYRSWDPFGWIEDDTYYAIFGGQRAAVAKSKSLTGEWKYTGDLLANTVEGVAINEDISCADFFKIGDRRMLLCISHRLGARYYLGEWKNEQFHPTFHEKMSWVDNSYFAPESLLDDRGRRIMWAWIFDSPGFKTRMDYGWSGTMSLPRVLTLGSDGMLRMNPPEEIERLRYNAQKRTNLAVKPDSELSVAGIGGNSIELAMEISAAGAKQYGVKVCCSGDGQEETVVFYDAVEKKLKIDTNKSSLTEGPKSIEAGPLELKADEPLKLRIFVDKSVVEVFANGRQSVMRRIYPTGKDSIGVKLFSNGGPAKVATLEAWEMMPSNPY